MQKQKSGAAMYHPQTKEQEQEEPCEQSCQALTLLLFVVLKVMGQGLEPVNEAN